MLGQSDPRCAHSILEDPASEEAHQIQKGQNGWEGTVSEKMKLEVAYLGVLAVGLMLMSVVSNLFVFLPGCFLVSCLKSKSNWTPFKMMLRSQSATEAHGKASEVGQENAQRFRRQRGGGGGGLGGAAQLEGPEPYSHGLWFYVVTCYIDLY